MKSETNHWIHQLDSIVLSGIVAGGNHNPDNLPHHTSGAQFCKKSHAEDNRVQERPAHPPHQHPKTPQSPRSKQQYSRLHSKLPIYHQQSTIKYEGVQLTPAVPYSNTTPSGFGHFSAASAILRSISSSRCLFCRRCTILLL